MKSDSLKQYVSLRDSILAEREQLIVRLREIDQALGAMGVRGRDTYYGPRTPTGRVRNELSLKEAVLKVIEGKSLTKHQILDEVIRLGYQFSTDDPLNSLGVILYGKKPKFNNKGGQFNVSDASPDSERNKKDRTKGE
jgi:hypothetical protein